MSEADFIALALLREAGWTLREVRESLAASPSPESSDDWSEDFRATLARLDDWSRQAAAAEVIASAEAETTAKAQGQAAAPAPQGQTAQMAQAIMSTPAVDVETVTDNLVSNNLSDSAEPIMVASAEQPTVRSETPAAFVPDTQDAEPDATAEIIVETVAETAEGMSLIPAVAMTSPAAAKLMRGKTGATKMKTGAGSKLARNKKPGRTTLAAKTPRKAAGAGKHAVKVAAGKPAKQQKLAKSDFVSKVSPAHHGTTSRARVNKTVRSAAKHPAPKL